MREDKRREEAKVSDDHRLKQKGEDDDDGRTSHVPSSPHMDDGMECLSLLFSQAKSL